MLCNSTICYYGFNFHDLGLLFGKGNINNSHGIYRKFCLIILLVYVKGEAYLMLSLGSFTL